MQAERENLGVESPNGLGSARGNHIMRSGQGVIKGGSHIRGGHYSSQGVVSDDADFNMNELHNDKMNEEIRKLLEENRRTLN